MFVEMSRQCKGSWVRGRCSTSVCVSRCPLMACEFFAWRVPERRPHIAGPGHRFVLICPYGSRKTACRAPRGGGADRTRSRTRNAWFLAASTLPRSAAHRDRRFRAGYSISTHWQLSRTCQDRPGNDAPRDGQPSLAHVRGIISVLHEAALSYAWKASRRKPRRFARPDAMPT